MEYIFFYLIQLADGLNLVENILFMSICIVSFILFVFCLYNTQVFDEAEKQYYEGERNVIKKVSKIIMNMLIAFSIIFFIPSSTTIKLIGATCLSKRVYEQTNMNDKFKKLDIIIDLELDKITRELRKSIK